MLPTTFMKTKKIALTVIAAMAFGMAQAQTPPAAQPAGDAKPAKVAKDQAEADLINSIPKETDAAKRLKILDKWTADYPETAFASERQAEYLRAYSDMKDCKGQDKVAQEMLKADPNSEPGHRIIIGCFYQIPKPDASDQDLADKTANSLISNVDKIYSDAAKPAASTAAQWQTFKSAMLLAARNVIPLIDIQKKDDAKAEQDLTKLLQTDPTDAQASLWFAQVLFGQREKKPLNQPPAIFEFERAGVYDGPNALPEATRKQMAALAAKYYGIYHGSAEGWDKIVAMAKANALPPADFAIKSTADLDAERIAAEAAADAANPVFATWKQVKEGLTGPGETAFWEQLKGSGLPSNDGTKKFNGKLVSMKPALNPKSLVISYKDPAGDITLTFETPLHGKMDPGAELEFWGEITAYTKTPTFMITLKIADAKTDLVGWKSLPIAAPAGKKTPAAGTKKQP